MCELCNKKPIPYEIGSRRRLWDLRSGWHCSVLGTCLTMRDLRSVARKFPSKKMRSDFPIDYQIHGFFAHEAEMRNKAAQLLTKLLDKRHAGSIRKLRGQKSVKELEQFWANAVKDGVIPGPYWAILSHPDTTEMLSERMFADVHMLSHLVGASNRVSVSRLAQLEEENETQRYRFLNLQKRYQIKLRQKNKLLSDMQNDLSDARKKLKKAPLSQLQSVANLNASSPALIEMNNELQLEKIIIDGKSQHYQEEKDRLLILVANLQNENKSLEQALLHQQDLKSEEITLDLKGQRLLYVGGRQQTIKRLRGHIEDLNGELFHHDGGLEKSINELARAVGKADAVVFPTDCVSHDAALQVKRLCRQSMKPFVPLRTSGLASLLAGLRDGLRTEPFIASADATS